MMNEVLIYNTDDGLTKIELHLKDDTVWLTQLEMAELFQTTKQNISKHLKAIFEDSELDEKVVVNYQLTTTRHGAMPDNTQSKNVAYYNLDVILAVGYRVRSARGAQFRRFASSILKQYLIEGAVLDVEKLSGDLTYFKKLQKRIRDIRTSERMFYQQVLDIFATSIDYDGKSGIAKEFFQTVQNKMLYAVTGMTAPELIFSRIDATKPDLGLTNFQGDYPRKSDLIISKNYLNEKELNRLNLIVSGYLDTAEYQAETQTAMTMADWKAELDRYLIFQRADILQGKGSISRDRANTKADIEYQKYQQTFVETSRVQTDYFNALSQNLKTLSNPDGE